MRFTLLRDKKISETGDYLVEVCDTKDEINNFSIKEIMNLLNELKETEYKDKEIFKDIISLIKNILTNNEYGVDDIFLKSKIKDIKEGKFSKYLLKIE